MNGAAVKLDGLVKRDEPCRGHRAAAALTDTARRRENLRQRIMAVLDRADCPLTAKVIADEVDATVMQVAKTLAYLKQGGQAAQTQKGNGAPWYAGDGLLRAVGCAFPVLIAWFLRVDPKMADLLELYHEPFKRGVMPSLNGE